ncbi:MAG: hypothetical protein Q4C12_06565 [Clostridia bacterium]|nr:hypothetical protein [Clostridia bacterium]
MEKHIYKYLLFDLAFFLLITFKSFSRVLYDYLFGRGTFAFKWVSNATSAVVYVGLGVLLGYLLITKKKSVGALLTEFIVVGIPALYFSGAILFKGTIFLPQWLHLHYADYSRPAAILLGVVLASFLYGRKTLRE